MLLRANAALTALVSTRIDWGRRTQGNADLPAVVLTRVGGRRDMNMDGASGLVESIVQADIYGETYKSAKHAARALRDAVNGYSGTQSGTQFQRISIESERDINETGTADEKPFRVSMDLNIWHDE